MRRSQTPKCSTPRLACVRPAASVHPEPGSNSSSYVVKLINQLMFSIQVASLFNNNRKILLSLNFQICIATNLCCQFNMSMNVSFFFCAPLIRLAGAKVQLFFNLASFFEKIFCLFFHDHLPNIFKNLYAPILSFRVGKDTTFTFYYPNLFSTFFKVFLICLILSLCVNFCSNAGAKLGIFFVLTSLL